MAATNLHLGRNRKWCTWSSTRRRVWSAAIRILHYVIKLHFLVIISNKVCMNPTLLLSFIFINKYSFLCKLHFLMSWLHAYRTEPQQCRSLCLRPRNYFLPPPTRPSLCWPCDRFTIRSDGVFLQIPLANLQVFRIYAYVRERSHCIMV